MMLMKQMSIMKNCAFRKGVTPAAGFSKKNFQGRGLPQKW